jgi:hypothetical protein
MEAVKILECSREELSGVGGPGTFRWWRRGLERPSPAGACCGLARKTPSYNRCGAGKWAAAGRESEAAVVLVEPQDNTTCGEGRAAAAAVRSISQSPGQITPSAD